jgi:hypothetical protein
MVTVLQIQTFEVTPRAELQVVTAVGKTKRESRWLDCTASVKEEARILFEMIIRKRETVESVRELIAIPQEIEEALSLYAYKHPEDALGIERVIRFRRRVAEEFERLVRIQAAQATPRSFAIHVVNSSSSVDFR